MNTIGKRLKQLRLHRKMSMGELGTRVGLAKSTIAGYESDFRTPSLDTIQSIARVLETTSDYLLGVTEQPSTASEICTNAKDILDRNNLHWDGIPLLEEDLKLIRQLLDRVVNERVAGEENRHKKKKGL